MQTQSLHHLYRLVHLEQRRRLSAVALLEPESITWRGYHRAQASEDLLCPLAIGPLAFKISHKAIPSKLFSDAY